MRPCNLCKIYLVVGGLSAGLAHATYCVVSLPLWDPYSRKFYRFLLQPNWAGYVKHSAFFRLDVSDSTFYLRTEEFRIVGERWPTNCIGLLLGFERYNISLVYFIIRCHHDFKVCPKYKSSRLQKLRCENFKTSSIKKIRLLHKMFLKGVVIKWWS